MQSVERYRSEARLHTSLVRGTSSSRPAPVAAADPAPSKPPSGRPARPATAHHSRQGSRLTVQGLARTAIQEEEEAVVEPQVGLASQEASVLAQPEQQPDEQQAPRDRASLSSLSSRHASADGHPSFHDLIDGQ